MKILYVDDQADLRMLVRYALEQETDIQCVVCASAREALDLLPGCQPDLILLDVMMPDMDGPAMLAYMQAQPALASYPVVFATGRIQERDLQAYKAMGASATLAKPLDVFMLARQLREIHAGLSAKHKLPPAF